MIKIGKALIFAVLFAVLAFVTVGCASAASIYVPDNYAKIQWAVDNASAGDTIIVRDGTYTENVDVKKRLTISSENGSAKTIVQAANPNDHVFEVTVDYVNISGFTVTGASGSTKAGIYIGNNIVHCNISVNNVLNGWYGIHLWYSGNNNITNNNVSNNHRSIYLWESSNNNITNNNVLSNWYDGIFLEDSSNNNITNNNVLSNWHDGIYLWESSNNKITNNNVSNNLRGIYFGESSNNKIYFNNFIDNSGNVYSYYSINIWNSPKITYTYKGGTYTSSLGNYWSDYTGSDLNKNGIGDNPYTIDSDKDNYPLMEKFENYWIYPMPEEPIIMKLKIEPGGKDKLWVNFITNLDDEFRVDLNVIDPQGVMFVTNPANYSQCFRNITVATLQNMLIDIRSEYGYWRSGTYTFWVRTNRDYAPELDVESNKVIYDIKKPEIWVDASKTNPWINETIILTVRALPYYNMSVESSYPSKTVFEGGKYDYWGPDTGGPIKAVMDEDAVKHYAIHFTDIGSYTIRAEDLDEYILDTIDITVSDQILLKLGVEDDNKIRVNFSTYLLDDDRVDLKLINPEGTTLFVNPTNPSQSFCNITVQAVNGMLINTTGWDLGTYITWIETNKSYIPILDVHSNPVVFEVGENGTRLVPTVFFFDDEPPFQSEDGGIVTIGDEILLYGTATGGNSTMDIAINNKIVKIGIPIQESGSFVDILPTNNLTPGFKEIEGFVDTHFALGEDVTGIKNNGSSSIFLKSDESILYLYGGGSVIIGNDLTIHGTSTGGNLIDIAIEDEVVAIDAVVGAGGEFTVTLPTPATPHTDTVGVKRIKAFIDTPFTLGENVSEAASSGDSSVFLVEGVEEGKIGVFAEVNESVELKIVRISVVGTPGHNITVDSSDQTHTIFPWGVLENAFAYSLPFNHIIDRDGVRGYGVYFNDTGTYTVTITDIDTGNTDSVDILVEEKKVTFDMVSNCTIGDRLIIKGTANTGTYVTIAVEDYVYPELDRLVIDANKQFLKYIDTAAPWGAGTAFHVPGYVRLEAFIDIPKAPSYPDIIAPTETDDGNTTVLMTNPTLSAYLSKNEVFKETGFRIWGIAPGAKSVDILTISPRGGNGTGLEGDIPLFSGTNVTGITETIVSVSESDHGFMKLKWVSPEADSGTYAIIVTTPGPNRTYDGVNNFRLLDGIVNTYCGGDPEVLASKTQKEIVEMVKNATINAPGSDDLLQELHLSVAERVSFDTGEGTYPSISGMHNGTITLNTDITFSKLYTYPCVGTGGHTEYARIWNSTGWNVTAMWNGYAGDWHNISFSESFTLVADEVYNYTIRTGSYPQIIHESPYNATGGTITCDKFIDANGRVYYDWIPAIRLY